MPVATHAARAAGAARGLPPRAGLGLKPQHVEDALAAAGSVGFYEVHAENYLVASGALHHALERIHAQHALSIHGVGLSIGSESPIDLAHLERVAALVSRHRPESFSEHLAWSSGGGVYYNDLLPLAYDSATLQRVCDHVDQVQERLGLRMLLENPATYLEFDCSTIDEAEFLCEVVRRCGCGLLLDVSNAYIGAVNHRRDVDAYLAALPLHAVGEIHLAGFAEDRDAAGDRLLIDAHGTPVDDAVWTLYERVLARIGPTPTLIERDNDVPAFGALLAEATRAERSIERRRARRAEAA